MSDNNQNTYFDLHTHGFGFLNRVRKVTPKKGDPFYATTITCLRGDDNERTYIDCKVVGKEAIELFEAHGLDNYDFSPQGGDKGSLSFTISDISLDTFTYQSNHSTKAGQFGATIKGRLLKVKYLKVNDVVLVQSPAPTGSDANQQAA
ncbi:DUF3577 domain-containing protein [Vibrio sp. 10N.261.46.E12]|uniref:DUF3577 domain-containing protein n=1 Tax=Vibrio splendidus TaxID=29497 RepID=A0A2N7M812_VIBSP|nr:MULTISPECIES: DUF3577 domain-containing protein [Vibrio]PMF17754.1 hypothetical protein BCV19_17715 [Vibrio splendidus]PML86100.1 hypothetical protein BCT66_14755 [Vibrio sp. 10N.261.49.E11]PMN75429.1 hypothetical protein BCT25_22300 [Vibrio sp. 10N.261.45.A6]PMN82325.1 hypothetical protein BCT22_13655 [Vibrio sp. 10N.261.45.A1]PMO15609.1 hypothetical protein BCT15_24730 [Vibrio splendidus]